MTKDKEPLPCPFCGVTPELDEGGVTVFPCKTRFCPASHTAVLLTHWNTRAKPDLPVHEQMARFAIDGAITSGCQGTNKPGEDHWLYPFWIMGEKLMKAEVQHTGSCPLCDQRAELEQTHVLVSRYDLLNLHTDCLTEIRDWAAYVPEWAVEKHDFWGSVKRLDDAYLALIGAAQKEQP